MKANIITILLWLKVTTSRNLQESNLFLSATIRLKTSSLCICITVHGKKADKINPYHDLPMTPNYWRPFNIDDYGRQGCGSRIRLHHSVHVIRPFDLSPSMGIPDVSLCAWKYNMHSLQVLLLEHRKRLGISTLKVEVQGSDLVASNCTVWTWNRSISSSYHVPIPSHGIPYSHTIKSL